MPVVDEYIAAFPPATRKILIRIREFTTKSAKRCIEPVEMNTKKKAKGDKKNSISSYIFP